MADTEEIIVKIDGQDGDGASGGADNAAVADLKSQYDALKSEAEADKAARAAADQRAADAARVADAARQDATKTRSQLAETQLDTVTSGIQAAQNEASSAEAEYASSMEKGDFIAAAKAQRKIAAAEAKIVRLDEAKADLEARKSTESIEVRRDDRGRFTGQQPADIFEAHLTKFTKPTADWMRAHRDWVEDPRKSKKLSAAHFDAEGEGITADTPAYFAHVEKFLGLRQETKPNGANGNGTAQPVRRVAPPVAPVNGGGGVGSSGDVRGTEIRLSQREHIAATDGTHVWGRHDLAAGRIKDASMIGKPIGDTEFAKRKIWAQSNNLYDKSYTES